jgi:hypothetical protein
MLLTVSGFKAPVDSTLKKNLLGAFVRSKGASGLSSGNSKHHRIIEPMISFNSYPNVLNEAILPVQDRLYVEDCYLDHIQMIHPRKFDSIVLRFQKELFLHKLESIWHVLFQSLLLHVLLNEVLVLFEV